MLAVGGLPVCAKMWCKLLIKSISKFPKILSRKGSRLQTFTKYSLRFRLEHFRKIAEVKTLFIFPLSFSSLGYTILHNHALIKLTGYWQFGTVRNFQSCCFSKGFCTLFTVFIFKVKFTGFFYKTGLKNFFCTMTTSDLILW